MNFNMVKLLSSDHIGKFVFFMFLLSKYYQYYSNSGVAPRRKVPNYFVYITTIDILYIINYRRGHSLKFAKKKKKKKKKEESFFLR